MISLEQTWAFQYGKFSHIAGWRTPWPGWWFMGAAAWGSQDHIKAVLVGTACPCSKVRRINHPEQKKLSLFSAEWSYLEKLFLGKIHFCPGNILCVLDFTNNLPDSGRYLSSVLPVLSTSASPPAKPPYSLHSPVLLKRWFPLGICLTSTALSLAYPTPPSPSWQSDDLVQRVWDRIHRKQASSITLGSPLPATEVLSYSCLLHQSADY